MSFWNDFNMSSLKNTTNLSPRPKWVGNWWPFFFEHWFFSLQGSTSYGWHLLQSFEINWEQCRSRTVCTPDMMTKIKGSWEKLQGMSSWFKICVLFSYWVFIISVPKNLSESTWNLRPQEYLAILISSTLQINGNKVCFYTSINSALYLLWTVLKGK